jgi:hypothetical protein
LGFRNVGSSQFGAYFACSRASAIKSPLSHTPLLPAASEALPPEGERSSLKEVDEAEDKIGAF